MNTKLIQQTASRTLAGSISFPEVVRDLLAAGVETYQVDYIGRRKTFYAGEGFAVVVTPIDFPDLPEIAPAVLQAQSGQPPGTVAVVISADRTVKYETVVKVMDTLQRAGVQRVGLSVQLSP